MSDARLICGDCRDVLPTLAEGSIDLVLADLPYGTTACAWDSVIPFAPLWENYKRLLKPGGAVVLTGSQPFTSTLILSNLQWFRYEMIWEKTMPTGFLDANRKPMRNHENILVFAQGRTTYNPQMRRGDPYVVRRSHGCGGEALTADPNILNGAWTTINEGKRYPKSVIRIPHDGVTVHPTQKPVALMEYLIRTYSNPGDAVLDNTMGSGTTGVACVATGRKFIGIEIDPAYVEIARRRIERPHARLARPGKDDAPFALAGLEAPA
jgi:site-specific DNA-methyltransferase (adenine-specific)